MPGTDNSLMEAKVLLRLDHLPKGNLVVLDAFGGFGAVWREVALRSGREIARVGIDKQDRPGCLKGDNRKWLKGMDLSQFTVIDLDAYGVPYDQVMILKNKKYKGHVFFTFITVGMGAIPIKLVGNRDAWKACPTIWGQIAWRLWLDYLGSLGVKRVWHRSEFRKHYGYFELT